VWEQERSELEASALKQREDLDREYSRHVQELRASAASRAAELESKASNEKALLEKWVCKSYHHSFPIIHSFLLCSSTASSMAGACLVLLDCLLYLVVAGVTKLAAMSFLFST
jgi:hypothetical protein